MGKKNKKAIWIADEYALDVEMNRALLDMLHTRKVAKPKKAKRIYKELLAQRAAEEKAPCMGAGKAEVIQEVIARVGNPQMGRGKTATIPLVTSTKTLFEVQGTRAGNVAEFCKMPDGAFYMGVSGDSWGGCFADITLTPEQFAAFKQWVMEN